MKHLIFDVESTGLIDNSIRAADKQPRIIEIAVAVWDDAADTVFALDGVVNPEIPIPPKITQVTGITDAMVQDKPPFRSEHAITLRDMIEGADVVVAHNLSFDKLIVNSEFERANERKPTWPRGVCTVEATEHILGRRMKLGELHQYLFAKGIEGAHRASNDVEALLRCYRELIKRGEI